MKGSLKQFGVYLSAVALLFSLTGCGLLEGGEVQEAESALAENQREIYGKITAVRGNEVDIDLGMPKERQEPGEENAEAEESRQGEEQDWAEGWEEKFPEGEVMEEMQGGPPEGLERGFPEGGMPDGMEDGPGRGGMAFAQTELELTGEQQTILIPVGVPVTAVFGENELKTDFTQLSSDQIIRVVLQETDSGEEAVVAVTLLS